MCVADVDKAMDGGRNGKGVVRGLPSQSVTPKR